MGTIETFHQTSGWPVDSGSFSATSTEIATLKKQLWNAARQQPDEMIQFAWSYMQPSLTPSSTNLYNSYKTYVEQNNGPNPPGPVTPPPSNPPTSQPLEATTTYSRVRPQQQVFGKRKSCR